MADVPAPTGPARRSRLPSFHQLVATRGFQRWAARFPLTRRLVRREGEALFDLLAGFCHSQVLMALVQLDIPETLMAGPVAGRSLAARTGVPEERMAVLLRAGVALGLLKERRGGCFALTQRGAALAGVPGLQAMIRHHDVLYRDLADPVAFFRGETDPELAGFWPYVFGGEVDPQVAATYSDLMAQSQLLVADDTLDAVSLKNVSHLMDIGGGTGAFLAEAGNRYPALRMTLFDLPAVAPHAEARFAQAGLTGRTRVAGGSFRSDPLPEGADAISLVRVLYDHTDETVAALLSKVFGVLPPGGRLIISEPMSGGRRPERAGDAYFAIYTLAMGTGKARSAAEIGAMCRAAGFEKVQEFSARRPFITRCLVATKGRKAMSN
ncbi:methyltransferase [Marimonas sp. MJW-29]|uniref:Methyltransferase n=1 Tax=Sulfitobacter sediminis TaxID=3234186 RepID=A0ABV3RS21_9RHOB